MLLNKKIKLFVSVLGLLFVMNPVLSREFDYKHGYLVYSPDKDMIEVDLSQGESSDKIDVKLGVKKLVPTEWLGYVTELDADDYENWEDFNVLADKRYAHASEDASAVLYAESRSFFHYSDLVGTAVDIVVDVVDKAYYGESEDRRFKINKDDPSKIYLIRVYSGGWGKYEDWNERKDIVSTFPHAQERLDKAFRLNTILAASDFVSVLVPVEAITSKKALNEALTLKIITEIAKSISTNPEMLKDSSMNAPTQEVFLKVVWDAAADGANVAFDVFADALVEQFAKKGMKRVFGIIKLNGTAAIETVNAVKKFGLATKVAERYVSLIFDSTPVETFYLIPEEVHKKFVKEWQLETGESMILGMESFGNVVPLLHSSIDLKNNTSDDQKKDGKEKKEEENVEDAESVSQDDMETDKEVVVDDVEAPSSDENIFSEEGEETPETKKTGIVIPDDLRGTEISVLNDLAKRAPVEMLARLSTATKEEIEWISTKNGSDVLPHLANAGLSGGVAKDVIDVANLINLDIGDLNILAKNAPVEMLARLSTATKEEIEWISTKNGSDVLPHLANAGLSGGVAKDVIDVANLINLDIGDLNILAKNASVEMLAKLSGASKAEVEWISTKNGSDVLPHLANAGLSGGVAKDVIDVANLINLDIGDLNILAKNAPSEMLAKLSGASKAEVEWISTKNGSDVLPHLANAGLSGGVAKDVIDVANLINLDIGDLNILAKNAPSEMLAKLSGASKAEIEWIVNKNGVSSTLRDLANQFIN